jgi:hypothetical protein
MFLSVTVAQPRRAMRPVSTSSRFEHVLTGIHQVQLGEDADCLLTLWVDGSRELEGVGIGVVYVCGGEHKNDDDNDSNNSKNKHTL